MDTQEIDGMDHLWKELRKLSLYLLQLNNLNILIPKIKTLKTHLTRNFKKKLLGPSLLQKYLLRKTRCNAIDLTNKPTTGPHKRS